MLTSDRSPQCLGTSVATSSSVPAPDFAARLFLLNFQLSTVDFELPTLGLLHPRRRFRGRTLNRLTVPYSLPIVPSRDPTPLCRERPPSFAGDRLRLMARGNFGERLKRERELREVSVDERSPAASLATALCAPSRAIWALMKKPSSASTTWPAPKNRPPCLLNLSSASPRRRSGFLRPPSSLFFSCWLDSSMLAGTHGAALLPITRPNKSRAHLREQPTPPQHRVSRRCGSPLFRESAIRGDRGGSLRRVAGIERPGLAARRGARRFRYNGA